MKRFRFSLLPVSVLRAHRELRAREAFGAAVHAYVETQEKLEATRARVARVEAELAEGRRRLFSPAAEAQALTAYRKECAVETEVEQTMNTARQAMEQRRAEYLEAHRKLEVVRRLETKARQRHQVLAQREEQAAFDDLAGRRHAQRTASAA